MNATNPPTPTRLNLKKQKEICEITPAMGGALFGAGLSEQLSGEFFVGIILLTIFGGIGWYAAHRVNKNCR